MNTYKAYANGALDGYNTVTNSNPYDPAEKPAEFIAYTHGYDYGLFLYQQDIEGLE